MSFPQTFAGLALLCALLLTAPCVAQSGGLSSEIVTTTTALTADQRTRLDAYVTKIGNVFASGNPSDVVNARNELVDLCKTTGISPIFRHDLALGLIKVFQPLAKSEDTYRATNAFLVIPFLRTPEAVDFLLDNVSRDTQPDSGLRGSAAGQLPRACANAGLSAPQMDAVAKRIVAAAREETNWRSIAAEIECVGVLLASKLPAAQADAVAAAQAAIINNVTERALKAGDAEQELVNALQRGLLAVRNQLLSGSMGGRDKLLVGISPSLTQITKLEGSKPAEFKDNPQQESAFNNALATAKILQIEAAKVGSP